MEQTKITNKAIFEASELGWAPGVTPKQIRSFGKTFTLIATVEDPEGEVVAWNYRSSESPVLVVVLND